MMVSVNTERYRPFRRPLVWSYGLGVDSTAGLMRMVLMGDVPDLILFANTGNEKQETYDGPIVRRRRNTPAWCWISSSTGAICSNSCSMPTAGVRRFLI